MFLKVILGQTAAELLTILHVISPLHSNVDSVLLGQGLQIVNGVSAPSLVRNCCVVWSQQPAVRILKQYRTRTAFLKLHMDFEQPVPATEPCTNKRSHRTFQNGGTKTCLAQKNCCLQKINYQPEYHTVTTAATGTPVSSCLTRKFAKLYEIGSRSFENQFCFVFFGAVSRQPRTYILISNIHVDLASICHGARITQRALE